MIALLLAGSFLAVADETFFVNDGNSALPEYFEGVYAIGNGGTELLFTDDVYALTASGLQKLGTAMTNGGGGLLYDDGTVPIVSDRVRVGLNYSYSSSRDSSVASAAFENVGGDRFQTLAETDARNLTIYPSPDGAVDVYRPDENAPICTLDSTSKDLYLVVRPEPFEAEPLIRYGGISYYGEFACAVLANEKLTVVNNVDLDHYVMGVCAIEMSESWPVEALKAQAVAARTFVQRMIGSSVYYYRCGFDVTADTYTQAYRGTRGVGENIRTAAEETSNQYLTQDGDLIDALYSAADGGATEDSQNVFGYPNTYLLGVYDPFESAAEKENPYSEWTVTMTPAQLGNLLGIGPVRSVTQTTSRTGNTIKLEFVSTGGQTATLIRDNCRTKLGLKNIRYEVTKDETGSFVFSGSGFGHNLGMSQWGAYAMAKYYEKDYRFILGFYYTKVGISYGELPEPLPTEEPEEETEPESTEPEVTDELEAPEESEEPTEAGNSPEPEETKEPEEPEEAEVAEEAEKPTEPEEPTPEEPNESEAQEEAPEAVNQDTAALPKSEAQETT